LRGGKKQNEKHSDVSKKPIIEIHDDDNKEKHTPVIEIDEKQNLVNSLTQLNETQDDDMDLPLTKLYDKLTTNNKKDPEDNEVVHELGEIQEFPLAQLSQICETEGTKKRIENIEEKKENEEQKDDSCDVPNIPLAQLSQVSETKEREEGIESKQDDSCDVPNIPLAQLSQISETKERKEGIESKQQQKEDSINCPNVSQAGLSQNSDMGISGQEETSHATFQFQYILKNNKTYSPRIKRSSTGQAVDINYLESLSVEADVIEVSESLKTKLFDKQQLQPIDNTKINEVNDFIDECWKPVLSQYKKKIMYLRSSLRKFTKRTSREQKIREKIVYYQDCIDNLEIALKENKHFIHPESISIIREMESENTHGFKYEVMINQENGNGPLIPVTAAWVKQHFDSDFLQSSLNNNTADEHKVFWTAPSVAAIKNNRDDEATMKKGGYENIKIRDKGNELWAITWVKFMCEWTTTLKNMYKPVVKNWYISSEQLLNNDPNCIPEFDEESGNVPDPDLEWKEVTEEFLRNGFGDYFVDDMMKESENIWNYTYLTSSKDIDDDNLVTTFRQINCKEMLCTYNTQSQQICGLMWNKERNTYRGMYMFEFESVDDALKGRYKVDDLEEEWVIQEFGDKPDLLKRVKEKADMKKPFVFVPPGKSKRRRTNAESETDTFQSQEMNIDEDFLWKQVPIKYQQFDLDTCLCDSLANAFDYLKYYNLGEKIHTYGLNNHATTTMYDDVWKDILLKEDDFKLNFQLVKIKNRSYSILDNATKKGIQAFTLVATDGSMDHVISAVDGFLFDPNQCYSIPVTKENLDKCCGNAKFIGIKEGIWLKPMKRKPMYNFSFIF